MKINILIFLLFFGFLSCNSNHKNADYADADLLLKYINDSLDGKINEDKYVFANYKVGIACVNCRPNISFYELIDTVNYIYNGVPLYIITDDFNFDENADTIKKLKEKYGNLANVFYEKAQTLERYALNGNLSSLFLIENGELKEYSRIIKN